MYQHRRTHSTERLEKLLLLAPKCVRRMAVFICEAHVSSCHSLLPRTCNELSVGWNIGSYLWWLVEILCFMTKLPPPHHHHHSPTTHQACVSRKSWIACCGGWGGTWQTPVLEMLYDCKWLSNRCSALRNCAVQRRHRHKPEVKNNKETTWRTTLPPGNRLCFLSGYLELWPALTFFSYIKVDSTARHQGVLCVFNPQRRFLWPCPAILPFRFSSPPHPPKQLIAIGILVTQG